MCIIRYINEQNNTLKLNVETYDVNTFKIEK